VRALGEEPGNSEGYWAQNYIDKAMELGILKAEDFDSYLGPVNFKQVITREEMCMIIIRAVERLEGEQTFTDLTQVLQVVTDSEDFSFKYNKDIMKTYKLGIITGYPDHTFKPQGVLTRAEASAVVVRLIDPDTRSTFDYEEQYNEQYSGIESHLLGGANWVDPVAAGVRESAEEDWKLITSDLSYIPDQHNYDLGYIPKQLSDDEVMGSFMYDENGPYGGHIEDFERLLQRRIPQDQVDIVMKYLEQKTDKYTYLKHDEAFFYLDNDRYLVRVDEVKLYDGQRNVKAAIEVNFNIWYRDQNFIDTYEKNITQIMPYTDVVIYRYTRSTFDYEEQYNEQHSGMESHLLGGANWVDPVTAGVRESAEEDWKLITSDLGYEPSEYQLQHGLVPKQSLDTVIGALMYDENGPYAGNLEDFERLLQRRMPQDQVDIVMEYLEQKKGYLTYLKHDEAFFYLDNDRYLVRLHEIVTFEGTQYEQAIAVNFNIWYRDQNFIDTYEKNITQIMPYTDVVIYR